MHENPLNEASKLVRAMCMQPTERKHNQVHDQEQSDAKKHAADNEVRFKEVEFSACGTVDRGRRIGDEVVQEHAEYPRADASLERLSSQQTCGDCARYSPAERKERRGQVE